MSEFPLRQETDSSHTTSSSASCRWRIVLEVICAIAALTPIVLFLFTSLRRLHYPFPLEQLEGSMLLAAERVAHGLPIYVQPNFHFIPYMYGPAYYYFSGWAIHLLGPGFVPLRSISLLSTCGSFAIIYIFVLLDTDGAWGRRHLAALAGAGLYAAAYPWTREWFDLGRLDSFYIFLLLLALLSTRLSGKTLHPILAAMAWTLAFLAKQTIFPVALVMLCHDWKRPRKVWTGVIGFLLMAGCSTAILDHATHGWFRFYAFTVPRANADLLVRPFIFYIPSQLLAPFGVALLIASIAWFCLRRSGTTSSFQISARRFYAFAALSTFFLCWFLQTHGGATNNTCMPVYAVLAVIFGISFGRIDTLLVRKGHEPARFFLLAAVCIPLLSWVYNPHDFIPHRDLVASNNELLSWLRSVPGDVFLPSNPYEAVMAGKRWHPDAAALHDALRPDRQGIRQPLLDEIRAEVDGEKFDAIVFDEMPTHALAKQTWLPRDLETHYPVLGIVPGSGVYNRYSPHPAYFLLPCRELTLAETKGWTLLHVGDRPACQAKVLEH